MLKVHFTRQLNGHTKPLPEAAFVRDMSDLPDFMMEGTIAEAEEVGEDYLPFTLAYTVDKQGYALVPEGGVEQSYAIPATRLGV
jgi:hypothetical protein